MKINLLHLKYSKEPAIYSSTATLKKKSRKIFFWKNHVEWLTHNSSFFLP